MSYVPEVTARWKRRATEIADAIGGGESSSTVSGTVSLSTASITALADAIDDRLRLSAIAVSIADVLSVKTNANDSVAVTGTVSATLPANLVIPVDTVAGTNNGANGSGVAVTVPVNPTHNVTVPVKANSANQPMSSAGIPVTVPVNPSHSVTVPVKSNVSGQPLTLGNVVAQIGVAVGSTTVPVSVVTNTSQGASVFGTGVVVPVAGGTANIQVANTAGLTVEVSNNGGLVCDIANTNNLVVAVDTVSGTNNAANGSGVAVVVPVTASGTVLDVKITDIDPLAKTRFHEAMETALEEADVVDVNIATVAAAAKTQFHEAVETALEEADTYSGTGAIVDYPSYVNNANFNNWSVRRDDGILLTGQFYKITNNSYVQGKDFLLHNGTRVQFTGTSTWQQVNMGTVNATIVDYQTSAVIKFKQIHPAGGAIFDTNPDWWYTTTNMTGSTGWSFYGSYNIDNGSGGTTTSGLWYKAK